VLEYISSSDINCLTDSEKKSPLEALLQTYNLTSTVDFTTRSQKNSTTATDNIFIYTARNSYSICPIINGLSDDDDQSITFNTITLITAH
jgi:hypothetical protein